MHPQIKEIFKKRNSVLPTISSQKFNEYVKELCELAGFTEEILGSIKDPKTNRKVKGYYPKFKLISSHTCRRSFVSNHYGQLDDKTIMAITIHKNHSVFHDYLKPPLGVHAEKLDKFWAKKNKSKKIKAKMRIVV